MNFRDAKYTYIGNEEFPETEDYIAKTEYTFQGNNNVKIIMSIDDRNCCNEYDLVPHFSLTAELDGKTIGTIDGASLFPWDILFNSSEIAQCCDDENDLLPHLYFSLLEHVLPMEYIKFYPKFAGKNALEKAKKSSDALTMFFGNPHDTNSVFLLVSSIYVEENYRGSGMLSVLFFLLNELFDIYGMAICINPLNVLKKNDPFGVVLAYNNHKDEQRRMKQIAEHFGLSVHKNPRQNKDSLEYVVAVQSSSYIDDILAGEDFQQEIDTIHVYFEINKNRSLENMIFPDE